MEAINWCTRIHSELAIQQHEDMQHHTQPIVKRYHLLGTKPRKKYAHFVHIDFFFQHLCMLPDGSIRIAEDLAREPRNIDFWLFLFRKGFQFMQKGPSRKVFTYDWQYIDW